MFLWDLTGPLAPPGGRFHVYYSNRGSTTQSPWAALDRDVTGGLGPETISIVQRLAGTYRYTVHDYSNRAASPNSPSLALACMHGWRSISSYPCSVFSTQFYA